MASYNSHNTRANLQINDVTLLKFTRSCAEFCLNHSSFSLYPVWIYMFQFPKQFRSLLLKFVVAVIQIWSSDLS